MEMMDVVAAALNQAYQKNQVVALSLTDSSTLVGLVAAIATNYVYFTKRGGEVLAIPPATVTSVQYLAANWWEQ